MPWVAGDAKKHKKGLTPSQAAKWAKIANDVLKKCQSDGGKDCEGKAIRIANSKFGEGGSGMKEQSLPKGSLRFDGGGEASVVFEEVEVSGNKTKKPKLKMVAYSGGIIQNHWYWGNLGIDLQGMKFAKDRYPLLANHDTDKRLAHMGKPVIENNQLKAPEEDVVFLDNEDAVKFLSESEKRFPFQASIYAKPLKIVRLEEGDEHPCNGFMVKGPGAVWLESEFREMSACVFGADSNTSAAAFSENDYEACAFAEVDATGKAPVQTNVKEVKGMNKEQFMKDHADLYAEIVAEVKAQFSAPAENAEIKAMKDEMAQLREKNKSLEKENDVRREKELKAEAAAIFVAKLSASEIPDRLYDKVQAMVDFNKFVKDQVLDTKAFGEACDTEIKSWIDRGVTVKAAVVLGEGTSLKGDETAEKNQQNTQLSERLLKHVGQEKKS